MSSQTIAVLIVAAGKGERADAGAGALPKQYRKLAGTSVIEHSIQAFLDIPYLNWVLPVIHPNHEALFAALELSDERLLPPVHGAATRQASVLEGLKALAPRKPDLVLIHDAARPLVAPQVIGDVVTILDVYDGALPALFLTDTIKRSLDGREVAGTEDRNQLLAAQTPQGFHFELLLRAHQQAAATPRLFTDDAEIAEAAGLKVGMVFGDPNNIKITYAADFARAERMLLGDTDMETRIGTGYDVHPFEPGDAVWLCGVRIPHKAKLQGHSDADVALHALTDAILGAIGEGDIGTHFPPSDMQWKGAPSTVFLKHAADLVERSGGRIVNLDVTIVCEAPKISPHVAAMQEVIAKTTRISPSRIAVKATTNEKLGFIGREEGIVSMASASIELPRRD